MTTRAAVWVVCRARSPGAVPRTCGGSNPAVPLFWAEMGAGGGYCGGRLGWQRGGRPVHDAGACRGRGGATATDWAGRRRGAMRAPVLLEHYQMATRTRRRGGVSVTSDGRRWTHASLGTPRDNLCQQNLNAATILSSAYTRSLYEVYPRTYIVPFFNLKP